MGITFFSGRVGLEGAVELFSVFSIKGGITVCVIERS